jgi:hypothetical protein
MGRSGGDPTRTRKHVSAVPKRVADQGFIDAFDF